MNGTSWADGKVGARLAILLTIAAILLLLAAATVLWLAHGDAVALALMLGDAILNCF